MIEALWLALPALALVGFLFGRQRAFLLSQGGAIELHSLPAHYGQLVLLWAVLPPLFLLLLWAIFGSALEEGFALARVEASGLLSQSQELEAVLADVRSGLSSLDGQPSSPAHELMEQALARSREIFGWALTAVFAVVGAAGISLARRRISPELRARNRVERALQIGLWACSFVAILTTLGIVLSLLFEAVRFFQVVSPLDFFFSTKWSPQTALRADQVGSSGAFGAIPVFAGTLLITAIAMSISIPVGLMAAIHLAF